MASEADSLYMIQRYIMALDPSDQSITARHIRQIRQILADSENKHLAYVALAKRNALDRTISTERIRNGS
jgi:uncharacterized protein YcbX